MSGLHDSRYENSPYQTLIEAVPLLVDSDVGIISYLHELPRQADMPDFFYYKAQIGDTGVFGHKSNRPTAAGVSLSRERALSKAVGEAVERYSSAIYFHDELILSSYRDLPDEAVHPSEFKLNTDTQVNHPAFSLEAFTEDTTVYWKKAMHIGSGKEVLIPAAYVFCPYDAAKDHGEAEIAETISTGLAAHRSFTEAAVNGILEVIERDCFMIHWMAMLSCPVITPGSLTQLHKEMIDRLSACGYKVSILSMSTDNKVPCMVGLMYGAIPGSVPFLVSAAAHLNPSEAVTKCLEELALLERLSKRMLPLTANHHEDGHYHIKALRDHLRFWLEDGRGQDANFLIAGHEVSLSDLEDHSTGNPESDLSLLVERIESTGYAVYVSDVTTPDIVDLSMRVVRAVVPGYVPLNVSYAHRPEGSHRLLRFVAASDNINPLPHPFA